MNRLLSKVNKRVGLGNAAMLLIVVAFLGQMLGFLRNRLVSTNFTQVNPGSTDAFFAAFQIPDFFYLTIAAGVFGVAFMPVIADRLQKKDRHSVWELTNSLLTLLSFVMFFVSVIIFVFAKPLLQHIVAPSLTPIQLQEATRIMRLIALNPLLFTLSGILTSVQQTFGRFFFFAVAPLFYNLAIIVSVYLFRNNIGVVGLGYGALAGAILQLLVASLGMLGLGFRYRPKVVFKSLDFRQVMRVLPARSIDQGVDAINSIVEINRAKMLGDGPVSYYTYATTLQNVPIMLVGTSIATAAFPRLANRLAQKRPDLFHRDFFRVMRIMIWIALPVTVISFFARGYLARLLYGEVAPQVSLIFGFLTAAIFFRILYTIISRYFYAQKDTKTPLFTSLATIALNIILVFNLARPAPYGYGVVGLALAQSIAAGFEVMLLVIVMIVRDPYILNKTFWGACFRIVSVTGFSVLTAFIMVSLLPLNRADKGFITLGVKLGLIAGVTLWVHVTMSALFGLEEAKFVVGRARKFILRPVRIYE